MLRTWLCKLAFRGMNSRIWPAKKTLEYMRALQAWTEKDLFLFWYRFFMDDSESIYVMGGLDQCDSSREHFISSLQRMFSETETKLRIIVTTTEVPHAGVGDELQVSMPPEVYHELRLDANSLFTENQDDLLLNLGILFQNHPRYFNTELELRIAEILGSPGLDDDLKHMVLTWLACDHIPLDIMERRVSTRISPTPELVFECILSDMPTERRTWARQLLFWLSHAVRAIRAEEFWVISQTILDDGPNYSIQSLLRWFTGLLRIENDELHLGHPRLCTWLNSGHGTLKSRAWWRYKSNRQGHFTILKTFLKYLRDPGKHAYRSIPPGLHGCPYAVQYWHVHYQAVFAEHKTLAISARRLAFETFADTMALELFADNTAFRSWIEAYICLSDPFTAPDPSSKRPLPIAAYFGLDNLVPMLEKEYPEDLTDALIEASRKGHLQIVRHLVPLLPKQFCLQDTKLEKLIMAVTSCDNDEVVQEIVPLIPKHHPQSDSRPSWISDLLLKACWLGNEHLVGILLDLGADPRTTMQHSNGAIRPLSLAIQTNRIGVIKLLLERHASLCLDDPVLPDMLSTWASKEVIELLLANGFKVEAKSEEGWTTLQYACANGRPMVADLLLKQRPSVDYIGPDWSPPICCSLNENIRTMKVLLAHGVDANAITSRKDEGNALYYAIQNNRLDICQLLVEHNADVNYTAEGSAPSIITALFCTPKVCLDIFKLLLNSGADLERTEGVAPGSLGRTVLLVASARQLEDAPEIIKLLLKHSANINARDTDGWTPIYTAACFGHVNNLRLLMDAKADLYAACGDNKWNSLQVAYHHLEVLRILLGEGMDPFEKYEASVSTLQLAAGMNEPACLKAMLERPGERKELATAEALHGAVISSCPEDVRILLDEGSDVNRIEGTQTLLSSALAVGNEDIIRMLLEFRPQLDHEGLGDKTLLHFTTARTTVSSLKLVINAGARLDGLDNDGLSPLSWAVYHQHTTAVQYLLTKSAARLTINISGRWGAPLHQACRSGSLEMVRSLVDNGADVNLPWDGNLDGAAPISQACVRRDDDSAPEKESIIKYLLDEAGAVATGEDYATNPIHMASFSCTGDIIRLFIQHGAKPDQPDWIGRNPIHKACYNTLEALEALDRPDNDFAARDKLGCVPLHFAVLSGEVDLLNHVLERSKVAGLDINVTDNDGWTPLLWAARSINFEKVIDFLLDNGADTGARGKVRRDFEKEQDQQWSATDIATYHGLSALAEKLENVDPSTSMKINARGSRKIGKESSSSYCLGCNLVSSYSLRSGASHVCLTHEIQSCYGTYFVCEKCNSFFLCFKCYNSKEVLHPQHDFEVKFGEKDDEELKLQSRTTELSSTIREQQEEHHSEEILDDEVVSNDED